MYQFPLFRLQRRVAKEADLPAEVIHSPFQYSGMIGTQAGVRREQQNPEILCLPAACVLTGGRRAFSLRPLRLCVETFNQTDTLLNFSIVHLRVFSGSGFALNTRGFHPVPDRNKKPPTKGTAGGLKQTNVRGYRSFRISILEFTVVR